MACQRGVIQNFIWEVFTFFSHKGIIRGKACNAGMASAQRLCIAMPHQQVKYNLVSEIRSKLLAVFARLKTE